MILPSLGAVTVAAPAEYLLTPFQNGELAFQTFLSEAKVAHRSMIYSATLPMFYDQLIDFHQQGLDSKTIFDHTEASTAFEQAQLKRLVDAGLVYGKDFLVGTSPEAHAILHIKASWVDSQSVWMGSWNYSKVASQELNTIEVVQAHILADMLENAFDYVWGWIEKHEAFVIQ